MSTIKLTTNELGSELLKIKLIDGMPTFANITQCTKVKMNVKDRNDHSIKNPFTNVTKVSIVSVILNSDYETAVTNQLKREDKDTEDYNKGKNTMPLTYGENNQFIGVFNENFVLQYRPNDNVKPIVKYFHNDTEIDKKELEPFLPEVKKAENQGTDREIFWRKLYLTNVIELTLMKKTYILIG